jgi:hypothetical protein
MRAKIIAVAVVVASVAAVAFVQQRKTGAQAEPAQLLVGLYAPSAAFPDNAARLAYVQGLAKAIQTATGIPTTGKAYTKLGDLTGAKPDFAVVDGLCVAAKSPGTVLAVAAIGGDTKQGWALWSRGDKLDALKGKKLAYVKTGCRDSDFIDNAMLRGEVKSGVWFGGLVEKVDVAAAVATVRDVKQADAVFAPASLAKGLSKVIDTGVVPTPAFVQANKAVPAATAQKVQSAVLAYAAAGGGIDGWRAAAQGGYQGLATRMGGRNKRPVMTPPDKVDINDQDVIVVPQSPTEQAGVKQHFWEPPAKRQ